jgi:diguanylate cyclase (GGDEF)-like protein
VGDTRTCVDTATRSAAAGHGSGERSDEAVSSDPPFDESQELSPHRPAWLIPACINAFSVLLLAGTAALLAVGPLAGLGPDRRLADKPVMFGVLFLAFTLATWHPVAFHYRGGTYLFTLAEVPLLFGLVFASPVVLVASVVAAQVVVYGFARRQGVTKFLFNVASAGAFPAAVAVAVFRPLLGQHSPVSPYGWAAGVAAIAAATFTAAEAVRLAMSMHGQRAHREFLQESLLLAASTGLAFVVLDAAWWNLWATIPLVLVGALIVVAYRGYTRLSLRFGALQRLYDFSRSLGVADLEPSGMGLAVLEQVRTVMRARRAELILAEATGIPRRVLLDPAAAANVEPVVLDEQSILTKTMAEGVADLYGRSRAAGGAKQTDPVLGEYREALVAPLRDRDCVVGALVALDREEELDAFDSEDLRLFEALAVHASASLDRARLVEELRYEIESKSHQATHDMLTGLANRTLFLARASSALATSARVAIAIFDLDRFKDVNDTLGHAIGDRLLCEISERLVRTASGRATVARLGGDEFAIVLAGVTGPEEAMGVLRDLNAALSKPVKIDGLTLAVTASTGLALAPDHGGNVEVLLQRADIAMYMAKQRRSTIELYSAVEDLSMQRRLTLGGELVHALDEGRELSVVYQPIADLQSGRVIRVEALARWQHPEYGWVPAPEFIEIAEQMGTIRLITDFVLGESCGRLAEWRRAGIDVGLAVNLSGKELSDEHLVDRVAQFLAANDLAPDALTLELTETEVMADLGHASSVLNRLADLGVRIAVDDYGTGYSSLAYLHRLPVKELKIDRAFVTNLAEDPSNAIIVRSSIAMAHSLGLTVVAEGAEDAATCTFLAEAGCDSVQGYHLSRPQKPGDIRKWLEEGGSLEGSGHLGQITPLRASVMNRSVATTATPSAQLA